MRLYHYTCHHAAGKITRRGMLRPTPHPLLSGRAVLWLTDMETPDRDGLGLTSDYLACDRLAFRYVVEAEDAEPWAAYVAREAVPILSRLCLETDRMPDRWWVLTRHALGVMDRAYSPR